MYYHNAQYTYTKSTVNGREGPVVLGLRRRNNKRSKVTSSIFTIETGERGKTMTSYNAWEDKRYSLSDLAYWNQLPKRAETLVLAKIRSVVLGFYTAFIYV